MTLKEPVDASPPQSIASPTRPDAQPSIKMDDEPFNNLRGCKPASPWIQAWGGVSQSF